MAVRTIEWEARKTKWLLEQKFGTSHMLDTIKHFQSVFQRLCFASERLESARGAFSSGIKRLADQGELESAMFGFSEMTSDLNIARHHIHRELVGALHDLHCTHDCLAKGIAKTANLDTQELNSTKKIYNHLKKVASPLAQVIDSIFESPKFKHLTYLSNESKHSSVVPAPIFVSATEYKINFAAAEGYPSVEAFSFLESVIDLLIAQLKVAGEEINQYLEAQPDAA